MNLVKHKELSSATENMSSAVVEFEGFQFSVDNFIVKELAFYVVGYGYHGCWRFLPPFPWKELSVKNKKTAAWITRHCHGLRWDSGELPYSSLELILTSLFASYNTIYTKGLEKTKFLERKSDRKVLNLNDFYCPKVNFLDSTQSKCPVHIPNFRHCALVKAFSYAMYIKETDCSSNVICGEDVNHRASQIAD